MTGNHKLEDTNLYELLGVEETADLVDIKKAYRKKALQCHPDKNPDNPKAAQLFHELSKALEILLDVSAKSAYDKVLKAKQAAKLRHKELDSKRQKLIIDLERREREAELKSKSGKTFDTRTDEEKLQAEILRLQKEGSRLLLEEQERMRQQIISESERLSVPSWDPSSNRIKIKWTATKTDPENGGYSEQLLREFLKKYGDITDLVILRNKNGSGLVEFSTKEASEMAIEFEKGLPENPIKLKWLNKSAKSSNNSSSSKNEPSLTSEKDYESLVLRKMRQAAERQRLIDEMLKEEQET